VDDFPSVKQSDYDIDHHSGMVRILASNFTIQRSENESDDEYACCANPMADDGASVPVHDTIEIGLTAGQISPDLPSQVGDAQ
jgi:hypothetical protein